MVGIMFQDQHQVIKGLEQPIVALAVAVVMVRILLQTQAAQAALA
jgi:hypothetical protein